MTSLWTLLPQRPALEERRANRRQMLLEAARDVAVFGPLMFGPGKIFRGGRMVRAGSKQVVAATRGSWLPGSVGAAFTYLGRTDTKALQAGVNLIARGNRMRSTGQRLMVLGLAGLAFTRS